jgi:TRAP-type uncharacterized transport system substrate-binding protein
MRKRWVMLTFVLLLRSTGGSGAAPLDTVQIDGLPCNRLCQSYMAWSRQLSSMAAPRPPKAAARRATGMDGNRSKLAMPAGNTTGESYTARSGVANTYPTGGAAANSNARAVQEPGPAVAAVAEYGASPTTASPPEHEANGTGSSGHLKSPPRGEAEKTARASPKDADHLVAVLMARPEIKSVVDLAGKTIAIDDKQSVSTGNVQRVIAAAGASEVQLSADQTTALNRLISGEVPAAVVTLAYPETAEWSPEIAGFKVFRIPLSPPSLEQRPASADNAAAGSNTRTTMQIAAATALAEKVTGVANPTSPDKVVAVLLARPEIKSVSDLTGKTIAINDGQSASKENVQTALVAAGATETQLSEGQTKAVDRLISREASAAVLTLVSSEAAEWFPDVAGFKIFRIPLSPPSLKERPQPTDNAAAGARAIKQQVAAATALAEKVTGAAAMAAPNSPSPNKAVAVLMARPEIKSVSDLTGKTIAIDDGQSASTDNVRTALVAMGAAEAQLSEGQAKAVDRLISGEVSAAILTLASSEAAEWFPDVAGFKIFRIPLSSPSLKALR